MAEAGVGGKVLRATDGAGLAALHEVLAGREFRESEIRHDSGKRSLWIPLTIKFGPHRGQWRLAFAGVRDWSLQRDGVHDVEMIQRLAPDAKAGRITIECLRDRILLDVDRVDVTLERRPDPAEGAPAAPLPEWFRKEVEAKRAAEAAERERGTRVSVEVRREAALWGALASAVLVWWSGAALLPSLLVAAPVSGATMWFCMGHPRNPLYAAVLYGLPGLGLMGGLGSIAAAILFGILHIAIGPLIVFWMREKQSLRL